MARLVTVRNLADPDGVYAMLLAAHEGLSEAASVALNARLVLTLMNHVGDPAVIAEALQVAAGPGSAGDGPADGA